MKLRLYNYECLLFYLHVREYNYFFKFLVCDISFPNLIFIQV